MADSLLDLINRREVSSTQFATYLLTQYSYQNLEQAYKDVRAILLDAESITSTTKLNKILSEINKTITPNTQSMWDSIDSELATYAVAEAAFAAETMSEFAAIDIKTPAKSLVEKYITTSIMSLESGSAAIAGVWSDFTKANRDKVTDTIQSQIKAGYSSGETIAQIVARVKTATQGVSKNDAERLVRTGVQFHAQQARLAMRDDPSNAEALEGAREVPVVTFDSRTSPICMSISDKYQDGWPLRESPIGYPAYHYGCRTIVIILPKDAELEGTRPAIKGKKGGDAEEAFERKKDYAEARDSTVVKYTGRRDKAFEAVQIPVKTPFSKFLKSQPKWYVQQLLGKTKADAFPSGELDLSDLTDKQLRPRQIDDLGL